jgi:D-aminopeptidase
VPITVQAICFDLLNGGDKEWRRFPPYRDLGYAAAAAASSTSPSAPPAAATAPRR